MTVVIPLAYSDLGHLKHFTAVLDHFGPYPEDSALILPTPEMATNPEVARYIDTICDNFGGRKGDTESGRAVVHILQNDLQRGWPLGPNLHFENAVYFMAQYFPNEAWLWLESDCYGLTPYWLTTLKQGYQMAGTPYMGWTEDSYEVQNRSGKRTRVLMEGKHMAGPGFYPPNYINRMGPNGAPNTIWKIQDRVYPFTIGARWEHRPVNHTSLICHKPRTVNWHVGDDGQVHCMDDPTKDELDVKREGVVDLRGVVFVHGPKDGSLAQMILDGTIDQFTGNHLPAVPKAARIAAAQAMTQAAAPPAPIAISAQTNVMPEMQPHHLVLQWVNDLRREWQEKSGHTSEEIFMDQLVSGLEVARRHMLPVQAPEKPKDPQESEKVKIARAKLLAGNIQLKALAKQMGVDKEELKKELAAAGFTFNGLPQWVKAPSLSAGIASVTAGT